MRIRTLIAALMLAASPALAGENIRADGRFSVWTPDQWVVVPGKPQFEAHNPPNTIYVVAARIAGGAADPTARARAFIEAELDEVAYKGGELAGTAEDEGDDVEFVARTVVDGPDLLIVLCYGEAAILGQPGPRQALERVRASLKAANPG
ncbi:MAG: hypothetical protein JNL71_07860 [Rhodospirillales bacterium]|nr:hypothetical protein [Rhodospirillales bacterium]